MWAVPAVPTRAPQEGPGPQGPAGVYCRPSRWDKPPAQAEAFSSGSGESRGPAPAEPPSKACDPQAAWQGPQNHTGSPSSHTDPSPAHWPAEVCVCEAPSLEAPGLRADTHPGASGEKAWKATLALPFAVPGAWSPVEAQSWVGPPSPATRVTGQTQGHAARASPSPCSRLRPALWAALGCNK